MIDAIRSFFSARIEPEAETPEAQDQRLQIAACALLLELAHADREFTASEQAHIEGALERHFALPPQTVQEIIALAARERDEAVDLFQFTRLIAQRFDIGQKMVLAEVMWGVVLADGTLADHESTLVRKISNLLDLAPGYLSEARRTAAARTGRRG